MLPMLAFALLAAGGLTLDTDLHAQSREGRAQSMDTRDDTHGAASTEDARREGRILGAYALNRNLRPYALSVDVRGERAVLSGTVESSAEKELAEAIARGVSGIRHVDNRITVDKNWSGPGTSTDGERGFADVVSDATITASVKSKLMWNETTESLGINVDTDRGRVTLRGEVDSPESKTLAGRLAANTTGVRTIDNQLVVRPPAQGSRRQASGPRSAGDAVSDAWITTKVKSSLMFSRSVDALDINVDTRDGVVNLRGTVSSPAERDLAVELARNVRGVRRVEAGGLRIVDGDQARR